MKLRKESNEVLYPDEEIVVCGDGELAQLRTIAAASPRARARFCAHTTPKDTLQEMFIVLDRAAYIRPHKHLGRAESFAVLEGEVDVVLFHDDGSVREVLHLGVPDTGKNFYYRLSSPIYHTLLIRTPRLVFHEVTLGPFQREDTLFAPWAPVESDTDGIRKFFADLDRRLTVPAAASPR